jgi:hypothetical protein
VSSAILYVAIVAIWACVLIPRWLRRGASGVSHEAVPGDAVPSDAVSGDAVSGDAVSGDAVSGDAVSGDAVSGDAVFGETVARRADPREAVPAPAEVRGDSAEWREEPADEALTEDAPPPLTSEESRQRMLKARRRLLGMLFALETAAIGLAVLHLAALWVVIPPSVMLAGYMLLLREAAHADTERAERERKAAEARARAEERALARARAAQRPAAPVPAPVPAPAAYEEAGPGRDFAPGLAGKYTTSNADAAGSSDQAAERYLRAVGD